MRKNIFTRLRTLLTAARVTAYTRQAPAAKPKFSLEPKRTAMPIAATQGFDDWMFEAEASFSRETEALSCEMNTLSDSLSALRETLALFSGETAFPVHTLTQTPCAILHHDSDLFDGETLPVTPAQDTIIGGEGVFLFDDELAFDEMPTQHAA